MIRQGGRHVKYWIFQATPDRYDLKSNLAQGKVEEWTSATVPKALAPSDVVFFWQSGRARGIYGWGIVSAVDRKPAATSKVKQTRPTPQVQIDVNEAFDPHLDAETIKAEQALQNLEILRIPRGTVFTLLNQEAYALVKLLRQRHPKLEMPFVENFIETEKVPPIPDPAKTTSKLPGVATRAASDKWTTEDRLGYAEYAYAIARYLNDVDTVPPLTFSIQAPWGGGKSSLMRMVQKELDPGASELKPMCEKSAGRFQLKDMLKMMEGGTQDDMKVNLNAQNETDFSGNFITVWFNAWKYQSTDQVWAGLADAIIRQVSNRLSPLEREKFLFRLNLSRINPDAVRTAIHHKVFRGFLSLAQTVVWKWSAGLAGALAFAAANPWDWSWSWLTPLAPVIGGGAHLLNKYKDAAEENGKKPAAIELKDYMSVPDYEEKLGFIHKVEEDLLRVSKILPEGTNSRNEQDKIPVVIFIDDLDRCSPGKVAEVFEAVNLFMAGEFLDCFFILGMDTEVVAAALEEAHKDVIKHLPSYASRTPVGWRFMDKFVQLPFTIPPLSSTALADYAESLTEEKGASWDPFAGVNIDPDNPHEDPRPEAKARRTVEQRKVKIKERADEMDEDTEWVRALVNTARPYFASNPRELKRLVNVYRFYMLIASARESRGEKVPTSHQLQSWLIFALAWPDVVRWIRYGSFVEEGETADALVHESVIGQDQFIRGRLLCMDKLGRSLGYDNWVAEWYKVLRGSHKETIEKHPWIMDERLYRFWSKQSNAKKADRITSDNSSAFW